MAMQRQLPYYLFFLLLVVVGDCEGLKSKISVLLVFGDSTSDTGNNNFIPTIGKGNFPPYGHDFPGKVPTGRFSDGKLIADFIASYLGIKELLPPYLDPKLTIENLKTGVCFASGGTGFDTLTSTLVGVISMEKQIEYFKEYKSKLESYIGIEPTSRLLKKAAVVVSAGTNDFILNYFLLPIRNKTYSVSEYVDFVVDKQQHFIKEILDMGLRNIAVAGIPPFGCLPAVITLHAENPLARSSCVQWMSKVAQDYNSLLQQKLAALQIDGTTNIVYADIYKPFDDIIKQYQVYGFNVVDRGCCGTGLLELSILCNPLTPVCDDASKYVFWDSVHPTQATYSKLFSSFIPIVDRLISKFV